MAWCPNCKIEYREGFTHCVDCDVDLVDVLTEEVEIDESLDEHTKALLNKFANDPPEFLVTAVDVIDAELIESFLGTSNIPVLKKFRESGDYLNVFMGNSNLGIDMFVPTSLFEEAKTLLESKPDFNFAVETDRKEDSPEDGDEIESEKGKIEEDRNAWKYSDDNYVAEESDEDDVADDANDNDGNDNDADSEKPKKGFWGRIFG